MPIPKTPKKKKYWRKNIIFPAISKTMSSHNELDFSSGSTPRKHLLGGGEEGEVFNCKNKIHHSDNTLEGIRVLK